LDSRQRTVIGESVTLNGRRAKACNLAAPPRTAGAMPLRSHITDARLT
jgi:hypothetical protein